MVYASFLQQRSQNKKERYKSFEIIAETKLLKKDQSIKGKKISSTLAAALGSYKLQFAFFRKTQYVKAFVTLSNS